MSLSHAFIPKNSWARVLPKKGNNFGFWIETHDVHEIYTIKWNNKILSISRNIARVVGINVFFLLLRKDLIIQYLFEKENLNNKRYLKGRIFKG